jgi:hypothetical protein
VTVVPTIEGDAANPMMGRCLDIFEQFRIVTQSVRQVTQVDVRVEPEVVERASGTRRTDPPGCGAKPARPVPCGHATCLYYFLSAPAHDPIHRIGISMMGNAPKSPGFSNSLLPPLTPQTA